MVVAVAEGSANAVIGAATVTTVANTANMVNTMTADIIADKNLLDFILIPPRTVLFII